MSDRSGLERTEHCAHGEPILQLDRGDAGRDTEQLNRKRLALAILDDELDRGRPQRRCQKPDR